MTPLRRRPRVSVPCGVETLLVLFMLVFSNPVWAELPVPASAPSRLGLPRPLEVSRFGIAQGLPTRYPRALGRVPGRTGSPMVWACFMAEQGVGEWQGIAAIDASGARRIWRAGPGSGLRSEHVNAWIFVPAMGLIAATDKGLHRFVELPPTGSGDAVPGRFEPLGPGVVIRFVTTTTDGGVWAVAERENGFRSEILRFDATSPTGQPKRWMVPKTMIRPLGVAAVSSTTVTVIFQNGLLDFDSRGLHPVDLVKSPVWRKARRDPDGPIPEIWIQDVDVGPDGTLFLIGHTRRLVSRRLASHTPQDGIWETLAQGHFSQVLAGPRANDVFITDFDGTLRRVIDGRETILYQKPGTRLSHLYLDDRDRLWLTVAPPGEPESLMRFLPPYDRGPEAYASLGDEQGVLSFGLLGQLDDGEGGLWISTNDGLWRLR